jgi:cytochrome P450
MNRMNDPQRLNLLAVVGPTRFAGNSDYKAMMEPVEDTVLEEVRRRQHEPAIGGTDIASMLAQARYEDGSPMTEQDLRDELVTLLTDGPTSSLFSWSFERLLRHPQKYARLRAEVDAGEEDAYLDAVI